MNPPPSRARPAPLLILSFLILPVLLVASDDATNASQQKPPAHTQAISPAASGTVKLIVTVTNQRGGFISGLERDSFAVFEGKSEREIEHFYGDALPADVGILVDVSRSMGTRAVEAAKTAALRFVELSHPENAYFISEFSSSARGLTDWTRDREKIVAALNSVARPSGSGKKPNPRGLTALYDAGMVALERVSQGTNPKRMLLIIGDGGGDNNSSHTFDELKRKIRESDALVYSISIRQRDDQFPNILGQAVLDELCALSGGQAYFPHSGEELGRAVERLAVELRHQYVIGFAPTNAARGGGWNKVKIKVTPPNASLKNLSARSRGGYFSTPPAP